MNLEELRNRRDVWPVVAAKINEAAANAPFALSQILDHPDLEQHLERKFRKGEAEHDRDWVNREDAYTLINDAAEEVLDYILYQAMYIVLLEAKANTNE